MMAPGPTPLRERLLSHRLRGFHDDEGSLNALEAALPCNPAWIEIDTRVTADGEILVFHDARLERLTTSQGPVARLRMSASGRPRFGGSSGMPVPTLSEFLEAFARHGGATRLMIDIKDRGTEATHAAAIQRLGIVDRTWVISWHPDVLRAMHALMPEVPLGFSSVPITRWRPFVTTAARMLGSGAALRGVGRLAGALGWISPLQDITLHLDAYEGAPGTNGGVGGYPIHFLTALPERALGGIIRKTGGGVGVPALMLTAEYVRAAHETGFKVFTYTIDSLAAATRAVAATDVDIVFTNNAALMRTPA